MDTSKTSAPEARAAHGSRAGFSLVEVTLALGVMAFAFISVFGLIPTGLNTFRQAIDASVESQISQKVLNDVQQTDFTQLTKDYTGTAIASGASGVKYVRFFDDQGTEIVPATQTYPPTLAASEKQRILYWVNTRVMPSTVMPSGTNATVPLAFSNLATVTIQVVNNPGNQTITADGTNLWTNTMFPVSTYSSFVAQTINQ